MKLILAYLFTISALAGTGAIPSGPNVKLLKDNLRFKNTDTKIMTNDSDDPTLVAKDAERGSLYIKSDDGVVYRKTDSGSSTNWVQLSGVSGTGTDNCVARWDGTGSILLQDSVVCVSDTGVVSGPTEIQTPLITSSADITLNPVGAVNFPDLTISQPAYINADGDLISQDISLTADVTGVLPVANGGTNSSTALNNDRVMLSSGGSIVESGALSDGQLIIGATGLAPAPATITGTANQVSVTNGANSITLATPQDIATTSAVEFASVTTPSILSGADITLDPTGNVVLPDLTVSQPAYIDASGNLVSQDLSLTADVSGILPPANGGTGLDGSGATNGQLLIGNGSGFALSTITGTANQVNVTNGVGSITLSTPQDIAATSSPTFVGATLSGLTQNSILFAGASGVISEDNANFTFNDGTDTLALTGILNADNLRLDGNTLSSTDTNGNILIDPDGTGIASVVGTNALDIPSGTEAQRPTASGGEIRLNDDTGSFEGHNGVGWRNLTDTRKPDIYYIENYEGAVDATDFTCDTNFTITNDTSTPLYGNKSVVVAQGATPPTVGAKCTGPNIAVPLGSRGKTHIVKIPSVNGMNDDDLAVNVYDVTNATELGQISLQATTEADQQQLIFKTESTTANIRLEFEVLVQNASASAEFDNIYFQDALEPASVWGKSSEIAVREFSSFAGSGANSIFLFTTIDSQIGDEIVYDAANGTFTAQEDGIYKMSASSLVGTGGLSIGILKNTTTFGYGSEMLAYSEGTNTADQINVATTRYLEAGDVIRLMQNANTAPTTAARVRFSIAKTGRENYVAVKGSTVNDVANANWFSARVAGTGPVGTESLDFINGACVQSPTGRYTCTYNSGIFTVKPAVHCSTEDDTTQHCEVLNSSSTASQVVIEVRNSADSLAQGAFSLSVFKQGSDYVSESDRTVLFEEGLYAPTCYIKDVKANGTNGGTATSGSWERRDLNTVSGSCSFVSLSSNQVTLSSGTYRVRASAPALGVGQNKIKLRNTTDSTDTLIGTQEYADNTNLGTSRSVITGRFSISSSKTYEIQHRVATTKATNGYGNNSNFGVDEIFTEVEITKLR